MVSLLFADRGALEDACAIPSCEASIGGTVMREIIISLIIDRCAE